MKFSPSCALVLGLLSACGAEEPPGPMGTPGNGSMISCETGKTFCDGTKLWSCAKSGTDAILTMDCAVDIGGNTATNPYSCFTSSCEPSNFAAHPGPACCRKRKYTCDASFDTNQGLNFRTYDAAPLVNGCSVASGSACSQTGVPVFSAMRTLGSDQVQISLFFFPDKIRIGQQVSLADLYALPSSCNGAQMVALTFGGKTCYRWTGSITWTATNPSFEVSLDLACQDLDKSGMKLKGTFKGDI